MWIPVGTGLWLVSVLIILLRLRRQGPDAANAFASALKSSARVAFIGLLLVAAFVVLLMNPDPHSTDNGLILLAAPGMLILLCFFHSACCCRFFISRTYARRTGLLRYPTRRSPHDKKTKLPLGAAFSAGCGAGGF